MNELAQHLPERWHVADPEHAQGLYEELQRELPSGHLLYGRAVKVVAYREATDDILCQHEEAPERFTVIHLSWLMRQESKAQYPWVEVDGDFQAFLAHEAALEGF